MQPIKSALLFTLLAGLVSIAPAGAATLYLGGDGAPGASLTTVAPTGSLVNHAPVRDDFPGLLIERGGDGIAETDPVRYQQWSLAPGTVTFDGTIALEFWAAMRDFQNGGRGIVNAVLLDCDGTGSGCVEIAGGSRDILDWSGGFGSWSPHAIGFGPVDHTVAAGRTLAVRLTVGAGSEDDMIFAYAAADFPSRLTGNARSDVAIDCDFSDWSSSAGIEFLVVDEGGDDDYNSPRRLDITGFAVSSNLTDASHFLFGFDDVPVQGGTAATLVDTDLEGNIDFALVATVDGAATVVELYECDNSISDGCGGATLVRSFPSSAYCTATGDGPWNTDTLVEIALPFRDLGSDGDPVILSPLVSYAAATLLTSPKDSVFGESDEVYDASMHYDPRLGSGVKLGDGGSDFVVRRSGSRETVRTSDPRVTVVQDPYDDAPGTLDDGDPASAPVDGAASSVTVDVASVPADGTTAITVTVVPRDAGGQPIGAGCHFEVDAIALGQGNLGASIVDRHDGSYTFRIVSTFEGSSEVAVTVEGVALDERPTVSFE